MKRLLLILCVSFLLSATTTRLRAATYTINYTLKNPGYVSVNVYATSNEVVRELKHMEWQSAGKHVLAWDGTDGSGHEVSDAASCTWKSLETPGRLSAQYLLSVGSNYVRGQGNVCGAPGSHIPPSALAVDQTGVYIGAGEAEGDTPLIKQTADGSARLWSSLGSLLGYPDGAVRALGVANGTLFELNRHTFPVSGQFHPQMVHKYDPTTGKLKSTKEPEGWFSIEAGIQNPADDGTDMSVAGNYLVVAYARRDIVRYYDQNTGAIVREIKVPAPQGVAVADDGTLYASIGEHFTNHSGKDDTRPTTRIVKIPYGEQPSDFITGLTSPTCVAIDRSNNSLLVYDGRRISNPAFVPEIEDPKFSDPCQQVKRFSLSDGRLLKTYGEIGGRKAGLYDRADGGTAQSSFARVTCVAADGAGGFYVTELVAPRRTAHFNADGSFDKEWYGGTQWSPCTFVDPEDPTIVWMWDDPNPCGFNLLRLKVDYEKRIWRVHSTYKYLGLASNLLGVGDLFTFELVKHNGKTYLAPLTDPTMVLVDEKNWKLRPVTICGATKTLPEALRAKAGANVTFQWNDWNGDGEMEMSGASQADEFQFYAQSMSWLSPLHVDSAGNNFVVRYGSTTEDGKLFRRTVSWKGDIPVYDLPDEKDPRAVVLTTPPRMRGIWNSGYSQRVRHDVATDDIYMGLCTNNRGWYNPEDCFVSRWITNDGGKTYAYQWSVGKRDKTVTPTTENGRVKESFHRFVGITHDCVVFQDDPGSQQGVSWDRSFTEVWDRNGLWVGNVFDNIDVSNTPSYMYLAGGEACYGTLYTHPNGRDVYLYSQSSNESRIYKITGWENWVRASGAVTSGATPPVLQIKGNGAVIADGDTTPATADNTDFGAVAHAASVDHVFTITNTGGADLELTGDPRVTVSGKNIGEFFIASPPVTPLAPGASTMFTVRFVPADVEERTATISIANSASGKPCAFAVRGIGKPDPKIKPFIGRANVRRVGENRQGSYWAGMSITVGAEPITATALGRYVLPGNSKPHRLILIDHSKEQFRPIPGAETTVQLDGAPAQRFQYASLPVPVILAAHGSYIIASQDNYTGDQYANALGTEVSTSAVAKLTAAVYGRPDQPWFSPTPDLGPFGPVDFEYRVGGAVSTPTFIAAAGPDDASVCVTIVAPYGATVRYTTDGTAPSQKHGETYSAPLKLPKTATMKAIGYAPGLRDSDVASWRNP